MWDDKTLHLTLLCVCFRFPFLTFELHRYFEGKTTLTLNRFNYGTRFLALFTALPRDQYKRARVATSSLIPFPRVGRSVSGSGETAAGSAVSGFPFATRNYYGQKRTGKSSLIPFPRVGRSGSNTWDVEPEILGGTVTEKSKLASWPFPIGLSPFVLSSLRFMIGSHCS